MLKEFIRFITGDPIMLGLSFAIVFLVLIFVLVLVLGGRKKNKLVEENTIDNTATLLKSDIENEPLKSTQEFTLNLNLEENTPSLPPAVETEAEISVEEVPAESFDIPLPNLEAETKEEKVMPIPVTNEIEIPVMLSEPIKETAPAAPVIQESTTIPELKSDIINNQPLSSVYLESNQKEPIKDEKDDLDDIELPMLNKSVESSPLSSLEGEHYNV